MFLAHFAVGVFSKRKAPKIPLWLLIFCAMLLDILALPGILNPDLPLSSPPWTHGLFMGAIWSLGVVAITGIFSKDFRIGVFLGLITFSHWMLDFIAWPMDFGNGLVGLPLFLEGSPEIGLGLYSTMIGSIVGEIIGLIGLGVAIYQLKKSKTV